MIWLIFSAAFASPPTVVTADQMAKQTEQIQEDIQVMSAFLRDEDLVRKKFAPAGWTQPAYEVYEKELDGRPSMLPLEDFQKAAEKAGLDPALTASYIAWTAERTVSTEQEAAQPIP